MKLTNKLQLPDAFVDAVKNDGYSSGGADFSVTGLLKPPKVSELERRHWDEIEEDVSDRVWSLFGQVTHLILERANKTAIAERRLSITVEGVTVSGGMDLYDEGGKLTDYKTASVYKVTSADGTSEWEKQLNMYAVILRANGHKVTSLEAVALCRDWRPSELEQALKNGRAYPQAQVVNIPLKLWPDDIAEKFLRERVILHKQARLTGQLPDCTDKERWMRDEHWAVKKIGGKMAVKGSLKQTKEEAQAFLDALPDKAKHFLEHRPGKSVRCENYCNALPWCSQGQALVDNSGSQFEPLKIAKEDDNAVQTKTGS